jgi:queuosine precursor transporter
LVQTVIATTTALATAIKLMNIGTGFAPGQITHRLLAVNSARGCGDRGRVWTRPRPAGSKAKPHAGAHMSTQERDMNLQETFLFLQQWQIALPIVLVTVAAFFFAGRRWTAAYVGLMPLINWSFAAVPTAAIPDYLGGGQFQPLAIVTGLVLVVRDFAQREIRHWIWGAMFVGLALSTLTSWIQVVVASGLAFLISETVDWAVYTFSKRPLSQRIMISSLASAPLDQLVFIGLASLVVPGIFAWGTVLTGILSKLLGAWIVAQVVARQERQGPKSEMNPA